MKRNYEKSPLVSVIIPVYNSERFLGETLQSIFRQDYRPIEIIVVDDGSTDKSAEIAQSYREIRYIHQSNQGPSAAINCGIQAANADFLAFLASDDLWVPDKLTLQVKHLLDNPQDGFVVGFRRFFFQEGIETPLWAHHPVFSQDTLWLGYEVMLARESVFKQAGLYHPDYRYGHNAEWLTRAKQAGIRYGILTKTLLKTRIHEQNLTHQQDKIRRDILAALKASIERKRNPNPNRDGENESI